MPEKKWLKTDGVREEKVEKSLPWLCLVREMEILMRLVYRSEYTRCNWFGEILMETAKTIPTLARKVGYLG